MKTAVAAPAPDPGGRGVDQVLGAPRSVVETIGGRARVLLGGRWYLIPDLPNAANRRWLARVEVEDVALIDGLDDAGSRDAILQALQARSDKLLDLLIAYDRGIGPNGEPIRDGLLDPATIDETATPREILYAVLGVWQAANPLVGIALAAASTTSGTWPEPTSSPSPSGDGPTPISRMS